MPGIGQHIFIMDAAPGRDGFDVYFRIGCRQFCVTQVPFASFDAAVRFGERLHRSLAEFVAAGRVADNATQAA